MEGIRMTGNRAAFKNKRVTVVGLGRSGRSAIRLLKRLGADVSVTDAAAGRDVEECARRLRRQGLAAETGGHTRGFIAGRDLVVVSPGVKASARPLRWAEAAGIPVIGEIELGYRFTRGPVVAITGSNGKSTVTKLTGRILRDGGKQVLVCGNIGLPATRKISALGFRRVVVEEVSSFQLSRVVEFRPYISVILNLSRNHLDWHRDFAEYRAAKMRIFANQTGDDWCILNHDDPEVRKMARRVRARVLFFSTRSRVEGMYLDGGMIRENRERKEREIGPVGDIRLQQPHNLANALAASLTGVILGVPPRSIMKTLGRFRGLEHRCEEVALRRGIRFVNDSKATTIEATLAALGSVPGTVVLIAGGRDKGSDFRCLRRAFAGKVGGVVLIGEAKDQIARALKGLFPAAPAGSEPVAGRIVFADTLPRAVKIAARIARPGWTVLLSPMCTSFDMFKNFEERGEIFKDAVRKLVKTTSNSECGAKSRALSGVPNPSG